MARRLLLRKPSKTLAAVKTTAEDLRKGSSMTFSVNTNAGAMVALQNLNATQSS